MHLRKVDGAVVECDEGPEVASVLVMEANEDCPPARGTGLLGAFNAIM